MVVVCSPDIHKGDMMRGGWFSRAPIAGLGFFRAIEKGRTFPETEKCLHVGGLIEQCRLSGSVIR